MLVVLDDDGVAVLILDSSQTEARMFARDLTLSKARVVGIDRCCSSHVIPTTW